MCNIYLFFFIVPKIVPFSREHIPTTGIKSMQNVCGTYKFKCKIRYYYYYFFFIQRFAEYFIKTG